MMFQPVQHGNRIGFTYTSKETVTAYCGIFGERQLVVEYIYHPEEKATYDEPGEDEFWEIVNVYWNGVDVGDYVDEKELLEILKTALRG